jgi:hypothetical protein
MESECDRFAWEWTKVEEIEVRGGVNGLAYVALNFLSLPSLSYLISFSSLIPHVRVNNSHKICCILISHRRSLCGCCLRFGEVAVVVVDD